MRASPESYLAEYTSLPISDDSDLREDLMLDELCLSSIAHDIEMEHHVDIPDAEVEGWRFVRDIGRTLGRVSV